MRHNNSYTPLLPPALPLCRSSKSRSSNKSSGRNADRPAEVRANCVGQYNVRNIGRKRLQPTIAVVVEDPVFSPVGAPNDQFVLRSLQWMERVGDAELGRCSARTICS